LVFVMLPNLPVSTVALSPGKTPTSRPSMTYASWCTSASASSPTTTTSFTGSARTGIVSGRSARLLMTTQVFPAFIFSQSSRAGWVMADQRDGHQRQSCYLHAHAVETGSKQSISLQQWSDLSTKQGGLTAPGLLNWTNRGIPLWERSC